MRIAKKLLIGATFISGIGLFMGHWSAEWMGYLAVAGVFLFVAGCILYAEWFA